MDKALNIENLQHSMQQKGLSQTDLATKIRVSRQIVSDWIKGNKFPRPDKLLRLALELDLELDKLISRKQDPNEPVIAFRKRGSSKTTDGHISRAKEMGYLLSNLVKYLPYDLLIRPATLKSPINNYEYIQVVAEKIRTKIGVGSEDELTFRHLINKFDELQAVIIPVMWGEKSKHENALHIHLPESLTTWIYLNLDVNAHDFKFWMAHELGHVYSPNLRGNEAEDFADALAGALIFPESLARNAYDKLDHAQNDKTRISRLCEYAECYSISLLSVFYEINKYAVSQKLPKITLDKALLYGTNTNFNKGFCLVSETFFNQTEPDAKEYIKRVSELFNTPFFDVLKSYINDNNKSVGFVQSILNIPLTDAKEVYAELT